MDASLLRWWDGTTWGKQTMPADAAQNPSTDVKPTLTAVPPLLTAVPRGDEPYVPPNSVFRLAETAAGDAYVPEWSGLTDISEEVARSGVPVQLALTSASSEPPIPVSADVFPSLRPELDDAPKTKTPAWKVEAPLAKPIDQLFPVESAAPAFPVVPPTPAPTMPAPAAMAAPAPVALGAPISPPSFGSTLSVDVFPVAPPSPPLVPQPAGDAFPGIVPSAPAPTMYAEPPAPPQPVAPVAMPAPMPVAMPAAAPLAVQPQQVPPQPTPPQAVPTVYAGPPAIAVGPEPVAPPDFQPFAASTPGATYVPLAPRPIPQPLQLGAPAAPPMPGVMPGMPAAAPESWPTQGAPSTVEYQPNPGDYVPFDPNAVHLEPVQMIPFSSRDPFNSASTSRPGMRAYASAPVGPSGSTWTGGLAFMLLAPLVTAATFFVWTQLTPLTGISLESAGWLPYALAAIGLLGLASAQIDRGALARRGYFDLASPFWVLLFPPLVYLIVRALRLRGQGKGAGAAIGLWVLTSVVGTALLPVVAVGWLAAPTPDRVATLQTSIQHALVSKGVTAVSCSGVTSLAPGSTFTCTATAPNSSQPIRVTITDWNGDFNVAPVTSATP